MVRALSEDQVREILIVASKNSAYAQDAIRLCYGKNTRKKVTHVTEFDHYSEGADYILNEKYRSGSGSKEYDKAFDAVEELEEIIRTIEDEASGNTSYGSKKNALHTLRKIGDSIVSAPPSTLGSEVRKHFQRDSDLTSAMAAILECMTAEELERVAKSADDGARFVDKVKELEVSADGYGMNMDLEVVLDLLR